MSNNFKAKYQGWGTCPECGKHEEIYHIIYLGEESLGGACWDCWYNSNKLHIEDIVRVISVINAMDKIETRKLVGVCADVINGTITPEGYSLTSAQLAEAVKESFRTGSSTDLEAEPAEAKRIAQILLEQDVRDWEDGRFDGPPIRTMNNPNT